MMKTKIITLIFIALCQGVNYPQHENFNKKNRIENNGQTDDSQLVLKEIESGIASGSVSILANYLSSQTYLSLSNGVSGYYSSNQAYYVLVNFFKRYQAAEFKFDNTQIDGSDMYGIGTYQFAYLGKRKSTNAYVSLKRTGKKWKITQITIN